MTFTVPWNATGLSHILSAAHDSFVFLSGVSVHPKTSSVRKRGVVLLLLPGQPHSCYHHRDRGHLPFSRHQQGAFGFSRTRWVFSFGGFFPADLMLLAFIHSFACFNFVIGGFAWPDQTCYLQFNYYVSEWPRKKWLTKSIFSRPSYTAGSNLYLKA